MTDRPIKTILILFCVILNSVCGGCAVVGELRLKDTSIEHETELGGA